MSTIDEIRHANLLLVLKELGAEHGGERGAIQRLADGMGRSHSQISQLKSKSKHSRTGKPRNIGGVSARLIEKAAGKEVGWMDVAHEDDASLSDRISAIVARQLDRKIAEAVENAPQRQDAMLPAEHLVTPETVTGLSVDFFAKRSTAPRPSARVVRRKGITVHITPEPPMITGELLPDDTRHGDPPTRHKPHRPGTKSK